MKIPLKYTLRNFRNRRLTTGLTLAGIALVSFVFAAVLMMAYGLQKTLVATGSDDNVIVLRKAANAEISSIISRDQAAITASLPHIAASGDGKPLISNEVVVVINLTYAGSGGYGNLTVRGVSPEAFVIRPQVHLSAGRTFQWGSREIIVGKATTTRYVGVSIGEFVKFGGDQWKIVGVFDAGGSGFDSEMWGDGTQLGQAFERPVFSTLTLRLDSRDAISAFRAAFDKDIRLQELEMKPEKQFYEEQSEVMSAFISILGIAITVIFSIGAMIGAMITMYAAVANRTVDIGTLRALGFQRRNVLAAFLLESLLLALGGGLIGIALASFLQFVTISMINFASFSELAFSFSLSPQIIIISLLFALLMGFVGGFLPAVRAARLNIVSALRSS
jgi:putative ABC transport system permease protein